MKKLIFTLMFALMLAIPAAAADTEVAVVVNGKLLEADAEAEIIEGRTFVPLRAIAEELGAEVEWKQETRGITLKKDGMETALAIGSLSASLTEGEKVSPVMLEAAPYIKDERTFVPLRFIAQGLGGKVYWCDELKTAVITEAYSRASGKIGELLDSYLRVDLPTAIKADNARLAADIAENPESVKAYFANLWSDRVIEMLLEEMTDAEKAEFAKLTGEKAQYAFIKESAEKHGLPSPLDCPIKMCAVTNNGVSALIIDAPTTRTIEAAPQCAFLSVDGSVVSVRL